MDPLIWWARRVQGLLGGLFGVPVHTHTPHMHPGDARRAQRRRYIRVVDFDIGMGEQWVSLMQQDSSPSDAPQGERIGVLGVTSPARAAPHPRQVCTLLWKWCSSSIWIVQLAGADVFFKFNFSLNFLFRNYKQCMPLISYSQLHYIFISLSSDTILWSPPANYTKIECPKIYNLYNMLLSF